MPMDHQSHTGGGDNFLTQGGPWFPGWLTIIASVLLLGAILHHLPCVIRGHGNRWFHLGHIAMSASMIYMYLNMSYRPPSSWGPTVARAQMWFFVATSALVLIYLISLLIRRRSFSILWFLLFAQQAGMVYMWLPMRSWSGLITALVTVWFLLEMLGWLTDAYRGYQITPGTTAITDTHAGTAVAAGRTGTAVTDTLADAAVSETRTGTAVIDAPDEAACGNPDGDTESDPGAIHVAPGWLDRATMAYMALSMAYMFLGMQEMRGFHL
ncbi:DUF5134 domain-containing protein [Gordonia rhizosphera]|nr:DUF5134 domain-containing protein [Gordonia rhizosphera]